MSAFSFQVAVQKAYLRDRIPQAIAWILPKRVVMWAAIRVISHATTGKYGATIVPELPAMKALDRFSKDNNL